MVFAHDTEWSLQAAVELANSALEPDTLASVEDLQEFFDKHHYTGRHDASEDELTQVHALRERLQQLFRAERTDAVEMVNAMLAESQALPQLVRHAPYDWHVHAVPADADLATRIQVETAMAMIDVIRTDELSRLGRCADDDCDGIVLDLSRNRSKRFCSTTCGNRNAVAAYRARQSSSD